MTSPDFIKLMIVGSTGLVGHHVLKLALADPRISAVIAPVRRPVLEHPKLQAPVIDFSHLPEDADWWCVDAVICAIGTTMKAARSQEAFRCADHDYPLEVARIARSHGARFFALNSAGGADPASPFFYYRVKGDLERDLASVEFESLTFVRPGVIGGKRSEFRLGERIANVTLAALDSILPRNLRLNPAEKIAQVLLNAAVEGQPGIHIVSAAELT